MLLDIMSWLGACCKASTIPLSLPQCRYCQAFSLKRMFWKLMSELKLGLILAGILLWSPDTTSVPMNGVHIKGTMISWTKTKSFEELATLLSFNMKSSFWAHHLISLCFSFLPSGVTVITFCWDYIAEHIVILFNVGVEEIFYIDRLGEFCLRELLATPHSWRKETRYKLIVISI